MKKAEEYREHAVECRRLASKATDDRARAQLLKMAETWDGLAMDREEQVARLERIKNLDQKIQGDE